MKNTKKAFTLVELIVVITILAVLATVAFISLTGYAQDAKNSKVASDLSTLTSALETSMTQGDTTVKNAVEFNTGTLANNTVDNNSGSVAGITIDDNTGGTGNYSVGLINFGQIGQNGADFKDSNDNSYLYGYFASGATARYQVAGQITEASGDFTAVIKGNYFNNGWAQDVNGLFSASGSSFSGSSLSNEGNMGSASLYK